jgi:hypothetical protein
MVSANTLAYYYTLYAKTPVCAFGDGWGARPRAVVTAYNHGPGRRMSSICPSLTYRGTNIACGQQQRTSSAAWALRLVCVNIAPGLEPCAGGIAESHSFRAEDWLFAEDVPLHRLHNERRLKLSLTDHNRLHAKYDVCPLLHIALGMSPLHAHSDPSPSSAPGV